MRLLVAGLSYKTAPVALREQLALAPARLRCNGCWLKLAGPLSEVVLLSTCNRVEIYGVTTSAHGVVERLFQQLAPSGDDLTPHIYVKEGADAVRHLFSVAGGLDSMVLGETEITGQVKQAYQAAQAASLTGRVTNRLFQTALQTAKEIRSQTSIGRGATSVGSVAVELAERIFDQDLSAKTVMIIGAGKMGEACVRHLAKKGARSVIVANRSAEPAQALAAEFGGRAVTMERCLHAMTEADIVVSSTSSPETILHREDVAAIMPARRNRPLFLIDIAVPRDIAPEVEQLDQVFLYNVDHLEAILKENVRLRQQALEQCQAIVAERTAALMARFVPNADRNPRVVHSQPTGWNLAAAACRV
jgi:glutamyl-tRNA reductase